MFQKAALALWGISTCVSASRQTSIFDFLPHAELFPACLKTVSATLARHTPRTPIMTEDAEPICENIIVSAPNGPGSRTTAVLADCAELSGRIEEAAKNGYLNDGAEFCSNILKQNAKENDVPLAQYVPRGLTSKKKFCAHFGTTALGEVCQDFQAEKPAAETPAAELLHSAEAMDAPPMPQPVAIEPAADKPNLAAPEAVQAEAHVTSMAAAPLEEDVRSSKMTPQYMKKNFGSILRFGGGANP